MALSNPRIVYGVHSFTPINNTTGLPYGILKVLGGSTLDLSGELVKLMGGSAKYPWAVEESVVNAELTIKSKEYPDFMFELFLAKAPTSNAAEANGSVTTLTNKNGTSVVDATTGIASVGVLSGSEADVKFGRYVVIAASATTVDVYAASDVDFARGTDGEFQDDLLKITATPLTITTATPVTVPNYGVELTGGSGTIGMTTGDTATFEARPQNTESMDVVIGGTFDNCTEFGAVVLAKKRCNREMFEIFCFRCAASGMPIGFEESAFAEYEVKAMLQYDSARNGVFAVRSVIPT